MVLLAWEAGGWLREDVVIVGVVVKVVKKLEQRRVEGSIMRDYETWFDEQFDPELFPSVIRLT